MAWKLIYSENQQFKSMHKTFQNLRKYSLKFRINTEPKACFRRTTPRPNRTNMFFEIWIVRQDNKSRFGIWKIFLNFIMCPLDVPEMWRS
jgi:hypothetical protein